MTGRKRRRPKQQKHFDELSTEEQTLLLRLLRVKSVEVIWYSDNISIERMRHTHWIHIQGEHLKYPHRKEFAILSEKARGYFRSLDKEELLHLETMLCL